MKRELMITFCSFLNPGAGNSVLYMLSEDNHATVLAIGQSYRMFTLGWPERVRFDLNVDEVPRNFSLSFPEEMRDPGAHNFFSVHQATSNLTNSQGSTSLVQHMADLMSKNIHHLDLTNIPGIDGKGELAIHFVALCSALQNNTFIRSFEVRGVPLRDAGEGLAVMLRHNRTITSLILADTGAECTESFGNALLQNPWNRIQVLDISSLKFSPNGALFFTRGLQFFNHSLSVLNIENCLGNNPKGTLALFLALQGNPGMSLCLKELNVAQNKMDTEGSEECIRWLNSACPTGRLKRLSLANTGVIVGLIMKESILKKLKYLDVSDNKFDKQHTNNFGTFSYVTKLKQLRISGCSLPSEGVRLLFQVLNDNKHVSDLAIDLSNNDLGCKGALNFYDVLDKCNKIIELDLAENNFKTDGGRLILSAIPASVTKLNVSGNFHPHGLELEEFHAALGSLLVKRHNLTSLNLSGRKERRLGKGLVPFFKFLKSNQTLRELDLSNNNMGDAAFALLCRALKDNIAITSLNFDQNNITQNGLLALKYMLQSNKILSRLEYPYFDLPKDEHSHAILVDILKLVNSRKSNPPPPNHFKFVTDWPIPKGPPQPLFSDIPEEMAARAHLIFGPPSETLSFKDMDTDRIEISDTSEDKNSKTEYTLRPLSASERSKSTPHGHKTEREINGKMEKKNSDNGKFSDSGKMGKKFSDSGKMELSNSDQIYEQRDFLNGIEETEERKLYNLSKVKSVKDTMKEITTGQWTLSNLSPRGERFELDTSSHKSSPPKEIPKIDITFKPTPPKEHEKSLKMSTTERDEKSSEISSSEEISAVKQISTDKEKSTEEKKNKEKSSEEKTNKEKSTEEKKNKEKSSEEKTNKEKSKEGKERPSKRFVKPMESPRRLSRIQVPTRSGDQDPTPTSPRNFKISDTKSSKRRSSKYIEEIKNSEILDSPTKNSVDLLRKNSGDSLRKNSGESLRKNSGESLRKNSGESFRKISGSHTSAVGPGKKKHTKLNREQNLSGGGKTANEEKPKNGKKKSNQRPLSAHNLDLGEMEFKNSPDPHHHNGSQTERLRHNLDLESESSKSSKKEKSRKSQRPLNLDPNEPENELSLSGQTIKTSAGEPKGVSKGPRRRKTVDERKGLHLPLNLLPQPEVVPVQLEVAQKEELASTDAWKSKSPRKERRKTTVSFPTKSNEKLPQKLSSKGDEIPHVKLEKKNKHPTEKIPKLAIMGQEGEGTGTHEGPGGESSVPPSVLSIVPPPPSGNKLSTISNPGKQVTKETSHFPTTYSSPLFNETDVSKDSQERAVPKRLPLGGLIRNPSEGGGSPRKEKRPHPNTEIDIASEIAELEQVLEAEELLSPKATPRTKFITTRAQQSHPENEQGILHKSDPDGRGSLK